MSILHFIKSVVRRLTLIRDVFEERDRLRDQLAEFELRYEKLNDVYRHTSEELNHLKMIQGFVPPGHFYSPIPCFDEIRNNAAGILT